MSLRLRITLLTAGVIFLALTAFAGLAGTLLWRIELSSITRQVRAQADALMAVARRTPGELPDTAEDLLERDGITAVGRVYEGGKLLWAGGAASDARLLDPAFFAVRQSERLSRVQGYLVASRRFEGGVVQVGRNLRPLEQLLTRYASVALLVLVLLAALSGGAAAWAVRQALRPLERLAQRVQDLGAAEPVPGVAERSEVGALARALDASLTELRAERERERLFLASASHELRTPVTAMLADVQHTLARQRPPEEMEAALRRTEKTATRLRQLTGNLMSLIRAQRVSERHPTDLLELAGEAVDLLQPLATARDIDLWLDGTSVTVSVDSSLMSSVFDNLIGNALKFSPVGSRVSVMVRPLGGGAEMSVEDNGPGFPAGSLTDVFVRGTQRAGGPEGFGLGLAVVKQVIEAHGGSLKLAQRPGGGAEVQVWLPS